MQLLGNLATAKAASKTAQQAAFDAALRIENPTKHSPDTIDCASCHVFSYRDGHPMIAVRVINETASVVAYLNGSVLGDP